MSKAGDTIENPVTGERIVVRVGTEDSEGELLEVDTYVGPGGAVTGENVHPSIEESFTVMGGRVGFRLNGRESIAELDRPLRVPAGTPHDWWNAGEEEAHIIVKIRPGARFETMALNLFGLAQDGKTNSKGMPNLLQTAIFGPRVCGCVVLHQTSTGCSAPHVRCSDGNRSVFGLQGQLPEIQRLPAAFERRRDRRSTVRGKGNGGGVCRSRLAIVGLLVGGWGGASPN